MIIKRTNYEVQCFSTTISKSAIFLHRIMRHLLVASVILSLLVIIADAQTFQYSRGWKNGKRTSTESGVVNPMLGPRFVTGLDKPTDKFVCLFLSIIHNQKYLPPFRVLIQRFLKSPCVVRLANALVDANQDTLQRLANDVDGGALLYDANGAESVEEARFKRDTADGLEYPGLTRF